MKCPRNPGALPAKERIFRGLGDGAAEAGHAEAAAGHVLGAAGIVFF